MNNNLLVLQSDFGLVDGAVSAMIGVALEESPTLKIHHLTHDITPYNIFEGSYRLFQTVDYWPEGTTFVSVVDPGVGSKRKSVVAKTAKNQYIVTPDNGTLSFIKKHVGIVAIREISEVANRRQNTEHSYTFHGRDVYAYTYTGAKLASGHITFEEVGPELSVDQIVELPVVATIIEDHLVKGAIDILDVRFGSLWTSITREEFYKLEPEFGDRFEVTIYHADMLVYQNQVVYGKSFADVRIGQPILYINSLYRLGLAINQGSFAKAYNVGVGSSWTIEIKKIEG
ncbi:TPA: S-adenosyl-l-methionine hydroxide adenosyltransferase family protein [Streptococcus pneumoniae]